MAPRRPTSATRHGSSVLTTTGALPADCSPGMTGKDVPELEQARSAIAPGTRVDVTYFASEDRTMRVAASRAVRERGFVPVPHVSARRLRSQARLEDFLTALQEADVTEELVVVGGDPTTRRVPARTPSR